MQEPDNKTASPVEGVAPGHGVEMPKRSPIRKFIDWVRRVKPGSLEDSFERRKFIKGLIENVKAENYDPKQAETFLKQYLDYRKYPDPMVQRILNRTFKKLKQQAFAKHLKAALRTFKKESKETGEPALAIAKLRHTLLGGGDKQGLYDHYDISDAVRARLNKKYRIVPSEAERETTAAAA